ncbi:BatD family protein [bacterium]|nr:BatD family protein [bacterium]MBU1884846.1 BatD family protein [bacterium]
MKKNLGKILLFLIFPLIVSADLATYSLTSNKKDVYTKEAVEITFTALQKDHTDEMFFFLEPKKSDKYEIALLDTNTKKISYHNQTTSFKYLLFPLKEGEIDVEFDFTIKVASDDAVAQIYTGGRNNVKWIDTTDTKVKIKPLRLHVKPLKEDVQLVGDFSITSNIQSTNVNSYGSANIRYTLSGVGYNEKEFDLLKKIDDVTIFSEVSDDILKNKSEGSEIKREFSYALVAKKDFTIPSLIIKAYSPKYNRYYTLKTESYDIKVSSIDPSTLVDDKEFPQEKDYDFTTLKDIFIASLIFLAGFVTAKLSSDIRFKKSAKKQKFKDIKDAKTAKELILVLLQNYKESHLIKYIDELEAAQYKHSGRSFKEIKNEILKLV